MEGNYTNSHDNNPLVNERLNSNCKMTIIGISVGTFSASAILLILFCLNELSLSNSQSKPISKANTDLMFKFIVGSQVIGAAIGYMINRFSSAHQQMYNYKSSDHYFTIEVTSDTTESDTDENSNICRIASKPRCP